MQGEAAHREDGTRDTAGAPSPHDPRELARWQRLVLPVMAFVVVGAGLLFAVAIFQEVRTLYLRLEQQPASMALHFESFEASRPEAAGEMEYLRFKALVLLEADALQRRYQQGNAAMMSRVWTRQMGFLTGMLMALIGSAFILGRMEVRQAALSAEGTGPQAGLGSVKTALATTSPGIVLAVLGTLLMAITIAMPGQIATSDSPVYLRSWAQQGATPDAFLPSLPLVGEALLPDPPPLPGTAGRPTDAAPGSP